jgi:hypothetical protein
VAEEWDAAGIAAQQRAKPRIPRRASAPRTCPLAPRATQGDAPLADGLQKRKILERRLLDGVGHRAADVATAALASCRVAHPTPQNQSTQDSRHNMLWQLCLLATAVAYDWTPVDNAIGDALKNSVFPGCVAGGQYARASRQSPRVCSAHRRRWRAVSTAQGVVYMKAFGSFTYVYIIRARVPRSRGVCA